MILIELRDDHFINTKEDNNLIYLIRVVIVYKMSRMMIFFLVFFSLQWIAADT